jgi:hypothetical protein
MLLAMKRDNYWQRHVTDRAMGRLATPPVFLSSHLNLKLTSEPLVGAYLVAALRAMARLKPSCIGRTASTCIMAIRIF